VTVAIVAIADDEKRIIAVSDRMISFRDATPATESTLKTRKIGHRWALAFSADDATQFFPILTGCIQRFKDLGEAVSLETAKEIVTSVYSDCFHGQFVGRHLSRLGYKSIHEFRADGFSELGETAFNDLRRRLDGFDLGISLLAYGYDEDQRPHIFEVVNPGNAIDGDLLGYGVVGTGYTMATASLRRKRLPKKWEQMTYRLLEAKFASETATGVGKSTSLIFFFPDGGAETLPQTAIARVRAAYEKTLESAEPRDAIAQIRQSPIKIESQVDDLDAEENESEGK
jgi:hypothetical protein